MLHEALYDPRGDGGLAAAGRSGNQDLIPYGGMATAEPSGREPIEMQFCRSLPCILDKSVEINSSINSVT